MKKEWICKTTSVLEFFVVKINQLQKLLHKQQNRRAFVIILRDLKTSTN